MIDESAAGRRDFRHDVERRANHKRRDPAVFDNVRDETDGLVAKRSVRHEQHRVDRRAL
jgi:hypothetical protein